MGVKRAMNIVLDAANKEKGKIYTYGPLVHNPQAIEMLRQKGVEILSGDAVSDATVIIRAHGISPEERRKIKTGGNLLCDATCPHVARAHAIIKKEIREGYHAIIVGDRGHAEVNGLLGYADGNGFVLENPQEVDTLPEMEKACVVAQTTQDRKTFESVVARLRERIPDVRVHDTICDSTNLRQKEVMELAQEVDAMVIVGGKDSANTKRLYEISKAAGAPSFHIENEDEIDPLGLERYENIGVMAGASTPNWVINKVIDKINCLIKKRKSRTYRLLESIGDFLVESTLYLGLGAVSMCYAGLIFQGIRPEPAILSIAFLYVFATHVFNRYTERMKDEFFDPARTRFFTDYGRTLIVAAVAASVTALYLSYLIGFTDFLLLLFPYLMGIIYSIRIVPQGFQSYTKYKRLKDVPGSKDFFVALAWTWVIALLPILNARASFSYESLSFLFFVMATVFIRSVVFDIMSIEGDRIMGRETIPILIGQRATAVMLAVLTLIISVFFFLSAVVSLIPPFGYLLILSPSLMVFFLHIFQRKRLLSGTLFEAVIDSSFILTGIIAFMYQNV